jgi:hypothetical protein
MFSTMTATRPAPRYADAEYQAAHDEVFSTPLAPVVKVVLPPGLSQDDFNRAVEEFIGLLGKEAVFVGGGLKEYVDPYEIPESGHERKVPSAAVWYGDYLF